MCSGLLLVEAVLNVLPQLQVTSISVYFGWMPSFMAMSFCVRYGAPVNLAGYRGGGLSLKRDWKATGGVQPLRMASKNSLLFFVALTLSSRNSVASRSSRPYSSLRRTQT